MLSGVILMKKVLNVGVVCLALLLTSCGGGGGSSPTQPPTPTVLLTTHSIQLGPIVGASVTIYKSDCKSPVYQTTTDNNGNYNIIVAQLMSALGTTIPEMLCVESVGGTDVDPNDDGIRGANEAIDVSRCFVYISPDISQEM